MAKKIIKNPKFKSGEIVKYTNPISKIETIIILHSRYDKENVNDISWWASEYPHENNRFAVPERELSVLESK